MENFKCHGKGHRKSWNFKSSQKTCLNPGTENLYIFNLPNSYWAKPTVNKTPEKCPFRILYVMLCNAKFHLNIQLRQMPFKTH